MSSQASGSSAVLLQGFGGSLGANAALPDASPPPELWVASSSQSCRIPYSSSGVLFSSGAAIPGSGLSSPGIANFIRARSADGSPTGPRKGRPDDRLRRNPP